MSEILLPHSSESSDASSSARVLLVEDDHDVGSTLAMALHALNPGWTVDLSVCLADALDQLGKPGRHYAAAIVDLGLPDAEDGSAPLDIQKAAPHMPIVVLTGQKSDAAAVSLVRNGIQDYVVKGQASPSQLALSVKTAIQRQLLQSRLESAALSDPLTGALNRHGLEIAFDRCIGAAERDKQCIGLILCDLNDFKSINDTYGHPAGDNVLRTFAQGFQDHSRPVDFVARLGGDEFAVVINGIDTETQAQAAAKRLISAIPYVCNNGKQLIQYSASYGISVYPQHGITLDELMAAADKAMYANKGLDQAYSFAEN